LITDLRAAPDYFEIAADRIWRAWWAADGATLADVQAALAQSLSPDAVPFSLIASADGLFAGTISAIDCDLPERADLSPWLAALWVEPEFRGQGIGDALMADALAQLRAQGVDRIYLCAQVQLRQYYTKRGAKLIDERVGADGLDVFELA
jgi:predicted N-acetyltransferase YhbS